MKLFQKCFRKIFIEHPESVNENYFTHGIKAISIGSKLVIFGLFEFIHAIIPAIDAFHLFGSESHTEIYKVFIELQDRKEISKIKNR